MAAVVPAAAASSSAAVAQSILDKLLGDMLELLDADAGDSEGSQGEEDEDGGGDGRESPRTVDRQSRLVLDNLNDQDIKVYDAGDSEGSQGEEDEDGGGDGRESPRTVDRQSRLVLDNLNDQDIKVYLQARGLTRTLDTLRDELQSQTCSKDDTPSPSTSSRLRRTAQQAQLWQSGKETIQELINTCSSLAAQRPPETGSLGGSSSSSSSSSSSNNNIIKPDHKDASVQTQKPPAAEASVQASQPAEAHSANDTVSKTVEASTQTDAVVMQDTTAATDVKTSPGPHMRPFMVDASVNAALVGRDAATATSPVTTQDANATFADTMAVRPQTIKAAPSNDIEMEEGEVSEDESSPLPASPAANRRGPSLSRDLSSASPRDARAVSTSYSKFEGIRPASLLKPVTMDASVQIRSASPSVMKVTRDAATNTEPPLLQKQTYGALDGSPISIPLTPLERRKEREESASAKMEEQKRQFVAWADKLRHALGSPDLIFSIDDLTQAKKASSSKSVLSRNSKDRKDGTHTTRNTSGSSRSHPHTNGTASDSDGPIRYTSPLPVVIPAFERRPSPLAFSAQTEDRSKPASTAHMSAETYTLPRSPEPYTLPMSPPPIGMAEWDEIADETAAAAHASAQASTSTAQKSGGPERPTDPRRARHYYPRPAAPSIPPMPKPPPTSNAPLPSFTRKNAHTSSMGGASASTFEAEDDMDIDFSHPSPPPPPPAMLPLFLPHSSRPDSTSAAHDPTQPSKSRPSLFDIVPEYLKNRKRAAPSAEKSALTGMEEQTAVAQTPLSPPAQQTSFDKASTSPQNQQKRLKLDTGLSTSAPLPQTPMSPPASTSAQLAHISPPLPDSNPTQAIAAASSSVPSGTVENAKVNPAVRATTSASVKSSMFAKPLQKVAPRPVPSLSSNKVLSSSRPVAIPTRTTAQIDRERAAALIAAEKARLAAKAPTRHSATPEQPDDPSISSDPRVRRRAALAGAAAAAAVVPVLNPSNVDKTTSSQIASTDAATPPSAMEPQNTTQSESLAKPSSLAAEQTIPTSDQSADEDFQPDMDELFGSSSPGGASMASIQTSPVQQLDKGKGRATNETADRVQEGLTQVEAAAREQELRNNLRAQLLLDATVSAASSPRRAPTQPVRPSPAEFHTHARSPIGSNSIGTTSHAGVSQTVGSQSKPPPSVASQRPKKRLVPVVEIPFRRLINPVTIETASNATPAMKAEARRVAEEHRAEIASASTPVTAAVPSGLKLKLNLGRKPVPVAPPQAQPNLDEFPESKQMQDLRPETGDLSTVIEINTTDESDDDDDVPIQRLPPNRLKSATGAPPTATEHLLDAQPQRGQAEHDTDRASVPMPHETAPQADDMQIDAMISDLMTQSQANALQLQSTPSIPANAVLEDKDDEDDEEIVSQWVTMHSDTPSPERTSHGVLSPAMSNQAHNTSVNARSAAQATLSTGTSTDSATAATSSSSASRPVDPRLARKLAAARQALEAKSATQEPNLSINATMGATSVSRVVNDITDTSAPHSAPSVMNNTTPSQQIATQTSIAHPQGGGVSKTLDEASSHTDLPELNIVPPSSQPAVAVSSPPRSLSNAQHLSMPEDITSDNDTEASDADSDDEEEIANLILPKPSVSTATDTSLRAPLQDRTRILSSQSPEPGLQGNEFDEQEIDAMLSSSQTLKQADKGTPPSLASPMISKTSEKQSRSTVPTKDSVEQAATEKPPVPPRANRVTASDLMPVTTATPEKAPRPSTPPSPAPSSWQGRRAKTDAQASPASVSALSEDSVEIVMDPPTVRSLASAPPLHEPVKKCNFGVSCLNMHCKFAHPASCAPPGYSDSPTLSEQCSNGYMCPNPYCPKSHPSPAARRNEICPRQDTCPFGAKCVFKHVDYAASALTKRSHNQSVTFVNGQPKPAMPSASVVSSSTSSNATATTTASVPPPQSSTVALTTSNAEPATSPAASVTTQAPQSASIDLNSLPPSSRAFYLRQQLQAQKKK